jgi:hypothetical protein
MTGRIVIDVVGTSIGVIVTGRSTEWLRDHLGQLATSNPADRWIEVESLEVEDILAAATAGRVESSSDLLLHAGAVAHAVGAVAFPGHSGSGKSTITAACVQQGFGYVTDEMIAVDLESLAVTGLPRPVMLTSWSAHRLGIRGGSHEGEDQAIPRTKVDVPIERLGGQTVRTPLALTHVVVPSHGPGKSRVRPLSSGQVLEALLRSAFNHYRHGEAAWRTCASLAQTCAGWRLATDSPQEAARVVCELVAGHQPAAATAAK